MILSLRLDIQEVDTDTDISSFPAEISKPICIEGPGGSRVVRKKLLNKERSSWSRIDVFPLKIITLLPGFSMPLNQAFAV